MQLTSIRFVFIICIILISVKDLYGSKLTCGTCDGCGTPVATECELPNGTFPDGAGHMACSLENRPDGVITKRCRFIRVGTSTTECNFSPYHPKTSDSKLRDCVCFTDNCNAALDSTTLQNGEATNNLKCAGNSLQHNKFAYLQLIILIGMAVVGL